MGRMEVVTFWKNKKVLVTGHTGFKGSWLSLCLFLNGAKLYGLSLKPKKKSLFTQAKISDIYIKNFFIDIRNKSKLKEAIHSIDPDIIFHLAAQPLVIDGYNEPIKTFETNINGSINLLEAGRGLKKLKTIIVVTTDKVYYPTNNNRKFKESDKLGGYDPYSASKAASEIVTEAYFRSFYKESEKSIYTVRAGNVLGGGDWSKNRLVPDIISSIRNKIPLNIRYPKAIRPWQHVLEPINGYMQLAEQSYKNKGSFDSFNFGPNQNNIVTVEEVLLSIKRINQNLLFKYTDAKHNYESNYLSLSNQKSKKILNWYPKLNLNNTISLTYEWYVNFISKKDSAFDLCIKNIDYYNKLNNEN